MDQPKKGRRSGGRAARRAIRSEAQADAIPYLVRCIPPLEIVSDEGLALIEASEAGGGQENLEGIDRSRPVFRLDLDGVPAEEVVGGGAGRIRDAGLVLLAADAFGAASRLIGLAVEYAKTREQFGQKIGQFQAVKHQIARLGLDIEPTRALFWYAAYAVDHLPAEAERSALLAKSHITDRGLQAAREDEGAGS